MPNDMSVTQRFDESAYALAREWGWVNPNDDILKLASETLPKKGMMVGQIASELYSIPMADIDRLMQSKPENKMTLDYLGDTYPRIYSEQDRILAMKDVLPFYANLSVLEENERMLDPAVHKRCEALDAVLRVTDSGKQVLVFSRYHGLKQYTRISRTEMANDKLAAEGMLFAVGSRDDISMILKMTVQHGMSDGQDEGGTLLIPKPSDSAAMREFARLVDHAFGINATDISIKPVDDNGNYKVRLRRWGKMVHPFKQPFILPAALANELLQMLAVKSGANPKLEIQRLPSDGNLKYRSHAGHADFRLNFFPLNRRGDLKNLRSLAMRIFRKTGKKVSIRFKDLDVPADVQLMLLDALRTNRGVIIVMGPVNSGKSTLCAAMIGEHYHMFGDTLERLSLENPVERELEGITQFEVPTNFAESEDDAWHKSLRGFKRQDLDLALVGEMRDRQSAQFCISVGAMGQMVIATSHANDTIVGQDIVRQMLHEDMRFQAAEAFNTCVGVRLINGVCQHCCEKGEDKKGVPPNEDEIRMFNQALENLGEDHQLPETIYRANPDGCDLCDNGYGDYLQIYEVLTFTRKVKDAAISMLSQGDLRTHRAEMAASRKLTLLGSGMRLLRDKKADIRSVLGF